MPAHAMLMYVHVNGRMTPTVVGFAIAAVIMVILRALQGSNGVPRRSNGLMDLFANLGFTRFTPDARSTSLQALADKLAFASFSPGHDYDFVMGWNFLGYLSQGEDRYAFNVLEGTYHDQKLFVFDYHFRIGTRDDNDERYYTIFMLIEPEAFPQILIEPESSEDLFSRIGDLFTNAEIKFESAEFSRAFRVRSRDKKFAYDVCNPQMMDCLLANRDLRIEIQGPVILLAFAPQVPVDQIEFNLERLAQIRSLLPQYLFTTK
jgi:hypothetical protein